MKTMEASPLAKRMSKAYWPNPGNHSAQKEQGDAEVDKMTLGELVQFYAEHPAGPTYCMVTRRVQEVLKKLPPHIEAKKDRVIAAMDEAKNAFRNLQEIVED